MSEEPRIVVGYSSGMEVGILPQMANRHGLIAGATGTGKTVTLKVLAEGFSSIGVPVFLADVKGDLSGLAVAGTDSPKLDERLKLTGQAMPDFTGFPVQMWDLAGVKGTPIRTTVSELGPMLLSRVLELNDTQGSVLTLLFKVADDRGLLLRDLKDLNSMMRFVDDHAPELNPIYGTFAPASLGAIQRGLINLGQQGGDAYFGDPALEVADLMRTDVSGKGIVNILAADQLINQPRIYATFLLWLLSDLFETLPEVGDLAKPKFVFFFDEAHLLFDDAPKALTDKVEQVARLIRSKGVGVYFITQNPIDIPENILGQLGNRVQHALRAFTPKDQKAVRSAAETFRANPKLDVATVIQELVTGEALMSFLDQEGAPTMVERALIIAPRSQFGPASDSDLATLRASSLLSAKYGTRIDMISAYETLLQQTQAVAANAPAEVDQPAPKNTKAVENPYVKEGTKMATKIARTTATVIAAKIGTEIARGLLGGIFGGRKR